MLYNPRRLVVTAALLVNVIVFLDACSDGANTEATNTGGTTIGAGGAGIGVGGTGNASGGTTGSTTGSTLAIGGSVAVLVNPAPGSQFFVGANFWRLDWEGSSDFFSPSVDWATVDNPWVPQFLTDLEPYRVLRFMDWNLVNEEPNPQANWNTRKQKTEDQTSEPIAYEWQIDLCNRTLKDCWLTVPTGADANFQRQLAGLALLQLDSRLRLYVEYANEVWNGSFPQFATVLARAKALGLVGTEDWQQVARGYVYESVRLWESFESVFGAANPRLIKVLSGQAAWDGPCQIHVEALQDASINPQRTMPSVYGIAPYFGGTSIAALSDEIPLVRDYITSHLACVAPLSLPVIGYEGGADSYAAGGAGCVALQHDPAMASLYVQYLDTLSGAGMTGPFNQYTHVGECWGLKERTTDTLDDSPKYRGVVNWLSEHP